MFGSDAGGTLYDHAGEVCVPRGVCDGESHVTMDSNCRIFMIDKIAFLFYRARDQEGLRQARRGKNAFCES